MSLAERRHNVSLLILDETQPQPEETTTSRQSSDRQQNSPRLKPAFQRQCSSPSFVDSYARYIERLQQENQGKSTVQEHNQEATIKASFPKDTTTNKASEEASPDVEREITEGFSSWPASISNSSKNRTQHAANPSAESLPQSPRHRKRHSTDWSPAVNRQETPADCLTTGGSVAAAVEDLESRCRSASQPNLSPRGRASQGFARHPSKLVARPCSPWPEPNYQPESDDEDRDVEQGLVDSANPDAGVRSQGEDSVENLACHASLAQVFNQEPGLQDKLLAVLQQEASNDDELLKLQVQELLTDYPEMIEMLNAQFRKQSCNTGKLREALYSTASGAADHKLRKRRPHIRETASRNQSAQTREKDCQQAGKPESPLWKRFWQVLVPPPNKLYTPWCTFVIIAAVICIFFFMAGSYPLSPNASSPQDASSYAPSNLRHWMRFSDNSQYSFSFDFLLLWGGQYLPAIREHQGWRWLTAVAAFLHVNFQHMLANMLLFAVVGGLLEHRYGTIRISIVLVLSTLGAAFFSGAFEDRCTQIVGASGAVMGFVGLTIADIAINSGELTQVMLRLAIIAAVVIFFVVTAVTEARAYTSSWSHLGGFVCGLFPGFLFIPDFQDERWRKAQKMASRLTRGNAEGTSRRQALCMDRLPSAQQDIRLTSLEQRCSTHTSEQHPSVLAPRLAHTEGQSSGGCLSTFQEAIQEETVPFGPTARQDDEVPGAHPPQLAPEELNPNSLNSHPDIQLLTEAPSDGGHLNQHASPFQSRRSSRYPAKTTRCSRLHAFLMRLTHVPIHLWLGGFALVGIFSALPTYIYVKHLPATACPVN